MASKLSILILGLLLIVPIFNALPVPDSSSEEVFSKQLVERFKLLALTLEEFGKMFTGLSENGPAVFEAVLIDPKVTEDKSEEMQKYVKLLSDYIEKTKKADKEKDETFDMFDEYIDIVNKFDSEKNKDLSPAAQIIEKSLKENGLDDIEKNVKEHFESFLKKFGAEVEEYFQGLNEKEKKEEHEFIEWYDKLKAEKDTEKKMDMFDNFVDDSNESD